MSLNVLLRKKNRLLIGEIRICPEDILVGHRGRIYRESGIRPVNSNGGENWIFWGVLFTYFINKEKRMYLSRSNLLVWQVASGDAKRGSINGLHVTREGATVATDGTVMLAVEPVDAERVRMPDVGERVTVGEQGITLPLEIAEQALKNLPAEKKRPAMQYAIMTDRPDGKAELTTVDMSKEQRVASEPKRDRFPLWRNLLRKAFGKAKVTQVCVNRQTLLGLLKVMEQACPDPTGDNAVFINIGGETDQMVLRSINYATNQRAVAMVSPLNTHGEWLEESSWEQSILRKRSGKVPR